MACYRCLALYGTSPQSAGSCHCRREFCGNPKYHGEACAICGDLNCRTHFGDHIDQQHPNKTKPDCFPKATVAASASAIGSVSAILTQARMSHSRDHILGRPGFPDTDEAKYLSEFLSDLGPGRTAILRSAFVNRDTRNIIARTGDLNWRSGSFTPAVLANLIPQIVDIGVAGVRVLEERGEMDAFKAQAGEQFGDYLAGMERVAQRCPDIKLADSPGTDSAVDCYGMLGGAVGAQMKKWVEIVNRNQGLQIALPPVKVTPDFGPWADQTDETLAASNRSLADALIGPGKKDRIF